jgi:hypothetical protein
VAGTISGSDLDGSTGVLDDMLEFDIALYTDMRPSENRVWFGADWSRVDLFRRG